MLIHDFLLNKGMRCYCFLRRIASKSITQSIIHSPYLRPYSLFIPHPDGCIGPHADAILLCLSPVIGFIPGSAHILQISSDNVHLHPVFPWPSQPSLVAPQFQFHCIAWRGILECSILNTCHNTLTIQEYAHSS